VLFLHAAPRLTASLALATLATGALHAPRAASAAWRAVMADCDGCSDQGFRLLASLPGHRNDHIDSISTAQLRRLVIDRPDPPIPLGAATGARSQQEFSQDHGGHPRDAGRGRPRSHCRE
jgi:hypothetical protein